MYKHGIEVVEKATAYEQPLATRYGVQVLIGTAPVNLVEDAKVNQPVRVSSWDEAEALLGYSDDWEKYTLPEHGGVLSDLPGVSGDFY